MLGRAPAIGPAATCETPPLHHLGVLVLASPPEAAMKIEIKRDRGSVGVLVVDDATRNDLLKLGLSFGGTRSLQGQYLRYDDAKWRIDSVFLQEDDDPAEISAGPYKLIARDYSLTPPPIHPDQPEATPA